MCQLLSRSRASPLIAEFAHLVVLLCALAILVTAADAMHHMKMIPPASKVASRQSPSTVPLIVTNQCASTIYPGILTQSGTGPGTGGFQLTPGSNMSMTVSHNWQGRVWGRTNCSFTGNSGSGSCGSGDCSGGVSCTGTGQVPTTLAEFTLDAGDSLSYYDLSLVDGYNLPIAIIMIPGSVSSLLSIPLNLTNPSCVGTVGDVVAPGFNPYNGSGSWLDTTSSDPLNFETTQTLSDIAQWCPFALQVSSSTSPSGGVYIYPDGNLNRPQFDPCYSACSKYNLPVDCCTGSYDSPTACTPSAYSKAAKLVCPDAYSYAFDDQTSTFIVPAGAGFQVIFCPGGRSTNIISTSNGQLVQLSQQALLRKLSIAEAAHLDTSANTTIQSSCERQKFAYEPAFSQPASKTLPQDEEIDDASPTTAFTFAKPDPVQVLTSTVLALPGSATSLTPIEWTIINQWQGTGLFGNHAGSAATSAKSLLPGIRLVYMLAMSGFMYWIAW